MEMRILAIVTGKYGRRHAANVRARGPGDWTVEMWSAPAVLPDVIDYPEEFVPGTLPPADLVLSFGEHPGVAELLPEVVSVTGARSVIAGIDNEEWLPRGLAMQLRRWLADVGVACVTPKPLCTLTETHYYTRQDARVDYDDPFISEFARHFGRPKMRIVVDPAGEFIESVEILRDTACGGTRHIAKGLVGVPVGEAELKAGLLHHYCPCLASMDADVDYEGHTLMHVAAHMLVDQVAEQLRAFGPAEGESVYIARDK